MIFFYTFVISIFSIIFLLFIRKEQFHETLRDYGPTWHMNIKKNTPTFGGFIIITPILIYSLILWTPLSLTFFFCIFSFAILGFIDDYKKIFFLQKNKRGLSIELRVFIQCFIALLFSFYLYNTLQISPYLLGYNLGLGIIFFWALMFVSSVNAVNITDGLDGLAAGLCLITLSSLYFISSHEFFTHNFYFWTIPLIIFLLFNKNPAKIFMGDTGSIPLGAILTFFFIITKKELYLIPFGCVFIIETLSDIIQIFFYRIWKRRFFLMAPFHHHLELKGFKEKNIVWYLYIFQCIVSLLGIVYEYKIIR
jgi:phospho-N-acetylmuramoyl-pentapeptide-transferase